MTAEVPEPAREYTEQEEAALAVNLFGLSQRIHRGELSNRPPTLDLVCWMHAQIFADVRAHAGKIRHSEFGSPFLSFGPHRSADKSEVPDQLLDTFGELQKALASFDSNRDAPNYEYAAIHLAAWVHARVIRIHPFEDGNGRTSRALLNWVLVRLGLRPIAFDVVKWDYLACLNHYFVTADIQPLVDLCIRVYPSGPDA